MKLRNLCSSILVTTFAAVAGGTASAATFVYISNAEDGDISSYRLQDSGELSPIARTKAASMVMPMTVSPDRRFLYAAARAKPYHLYVYAIDRNTGALTQMSTSPLADSFPYISLDRTGRFLLAASYGGNLVSVNAVGSDGKVGAEPLASDPDRPQRAFDPHGRLQSPRIRSGARQRCHLRVRLRPVHRQALIRHACRVPHQGGDGPASLRDVAPITGSFTCSSEFTAGVTTLAIDGKTGLLSEASSATGLPPDTKLVPGAPRGSIPGRNLRQRHLGGRHPCHAERQVHVRYRAHVEHDRRVRASTGDRQAHLFVEHADREAAARIRDRSKGTFLVATGEKSETVSVYAIDAAGAR